MWKRTFFLVACVLLILKFSFDYWIEPALQEKLGDQADSGSFVLKEMTTEFAPNVEDWDFKDSDVVFEVWWPLEDDRHISVNADGTVEMHGYDDLDEATMAFWRGVTEAYPLFREEICNE